MNGELQRLLGVLVVTAAASLDGLSAAFAYSASGIRVPLSSLGVIGAVCGLVTGVAFGLGEQLGQYSALLATLGGVLLLGMGLFKLGEGSVKHLIRQAVHRGEIAFSVRDTRFILAVYADPVQSDADRSGHLTAREALVLALALSADGFLTGLGYGLDGLPLWAAVLSAVGVNFLLLLIGRELGRHLAGRLHFPDWLLSGLLLTGVALGRLL